MTDQTALSQKAFALVQQLKESLPVIIHGPEIDGLTAGSIVWRSIQNQRSRNEIPAECFIKAGKKVLILRDPFLAHWARGLTDATRQPSAAA